MRVPRVVSAAKGTSPGGRLHQHQGQGVDVGLGVERLAPHLLGGGVAGGADHGAGRFGPGRLGQGPGQTEVGDADPALVVEEQVGRLDVPVDQAAPVGVVEGAGPRRRPRGPPARGRAGGRRRAGRAGCPLRAAR